MNPMSQYPARPKLTNAMLLEAAKVIEARLGGAFCFSKGKL